MSSRLIAASLLVTAVAYAGGVRALWAEGSGRGVRRWQVASFALGWFVVGGALLSPLHEASEQLFAAHMVQHELLMIVAAPLLVLGNPMVVMLWAFPRSVRVALGRATAVHWWRVTWDALTRPLDAWLIHGVVIWAWHLPALFQTTLHSETAHALQHVSFLGSALLFWWALIHPRRRAALGLSVVYLFTTAIHTAALGALLALSKRPWYPEYVGSSTFGLTALQDQQLAGMIMWIPASLAYLIAALLIGRRWLRESEWAVVRGERAVAAS